jgi:hypothetical protein
MGTTSGGVRITLTAVTDAENEGDDGLGEQPEPTPAVQETQHDPDEFTFQIGRTDLPQPVTVFEAELIRRKPLIDQLAAVLWSTNKSWHELAIAVRIFAQGVDGTTAEDAFLKYVSALDVLLGREEKGYTESQSNRIAERLAFLLGEDDPDRRWRLFSAFKTLYGRRSGIVHGGATTEEVELYRVESLARLAILRMAWDI